ncbi:hypothetical protein D3C87_1263090 [compost metagenome]
MQAGQAKHRNQCLERQFQRVRKRRQEVQELARPAHPCGGLDVETDQQPAAQANQQAVIAGHEHATDQAAEHRYRTDDQQPLQALAQVLKQRIDQNPAQRTQEKQQVAQLVHGEHGAASGWTHTIAPQQGHEGQRPAAAARRGAVGEFGGHDHAEAFDRADLVTLIPQ